MSHHGLLAVCSVCVGAKKKVFEHSSRSVNRKINKLASRKILLQPIRNRRWIPASQQQGMYPSQSQNRDTFHPISNRGRVPANHTMVTYLNHSATGAVYPSQISTGGICQTVNNRECIPTNQQHGAYFSQSHNGGVFEPLSNTGVYPRNKGNISANQQQEVYFSQSAIESLSQQIYQ